jgi:biopolymer transport protein ExbB
LENASYDISQLFVDGGVMMYPLLLASLLGLGVILAKLYILTSAHRDARRIIEDIDAFARNGEVDEALRYLERTPGPLAAVLLAGFNRIREQRQVSEVEYAMKTAGRIELGFLERGMIILATVATIAPLIGFLGTVWGMIEAFASIESAGAVEASLVAGGIKVALITTAAGLLIAIPVNVAYNYFVTRIDRLILDMEQGTHAMRKLLWDVFGTGELSGSGAPLHSRVASARVPETPSF